MWNKLNLFLFASLPLLSFGFSSKKQESKKEKPAFHAPACEQRVYNRGKPPKQYLLDIYDFIYKHKDDPILVGENTEPLDVFGYMKEELKLESGMPMHKRASRLYELLRVSAAMESSWDWSEDYDKNNPHNGIWSGRECGIYQTSSNSHIGAKRVNGKLVYFRWEYLDNLMGMKPSPKREDVNKAWCLFHRDYKNKEVIIKHHAFMLRHSYRHYGPMIRKNMVASNINHECIKQIETLLK